MVVTTSAAAAPPRGQGEAEVRSILVAPSDGGVSAHVSRITARVARNRSRTPSVGVLFASASSPSDQWSFTLLQAAMAAADATRSSLLESEFTLRVNAPARDRSAAMLTAATLIALIDGKKPLPLTSVVGAINPDGSAGPVEDVLVLLRAAAGDGLKRLGVPLGSRRQEVVDEAQRLGIEVRELAGLDDAYLFLTGKALVRPAPAADADMELWPAEVTAVRRAMAGVRRELESEQTRLNAAVEGVGAGAALKARLERLVKEAEELEHSGDVVRALVVWSATLTTTRVALQDLQLLRAIEAHDTTSVTTLLTAQHEALSAARGELRKEVDTRFPPASRANDMYAMDVLESVVTQPSLPRETLDPRDEAFSRRARQLAETLLRSREDLRNGLRFVALYASLPVLKKSLPPLDAERLASAHAAVFTPELAPVVERDSTSAELAGYAALLRTEGDARARLILAARQSIYAALLANVYGMLGGELDEKGVLSIRNPRALASQLEHARLRVLQSCGRASREASMVPFAAKLRYLNARAAREGSARQKTEALADLWIAQWWCDLAVAR